MMHACISLTANGHLTYICVGEMDFERRYRYMMFVCSPVFDPTFHPQFFFFLETFIPILYIVLRCRRSCCTCSISVNMMGYEDISFWDVSFWRLSLGYREYNQFIIIEAQKRLQALCTRPRIAAINIRKITYK
jgi:hypothetical protein